MQRSLTWWSTLEPDEQAAVLAMELGRLEGWVLDSMEAVGMAVVAAEIDGVAVRLPPTITADFLEQRRAERH